jgi:ATP-dependent protease ClpP protease subunit
MGLSVKNAKGDRPVLVLYGDIGAQFDGVTANDFRQTLAEIPNDAEIELQIHSDGGDYHEGIAMYSLIKRRRGRTIGVVDSVAASAATFPLMACDRVVMFNNSWMLIHSAHGGLRDGGEQDFREAADRLAETNAQIRSIYTDRWKGTEAELKEALTKDTWLTATECLELGLADEVSEAMALAAHVDAAKFGYKNVPEPLLTAKVEFPRLAMAEAAINELFPEGSQQ